MGISRQAPQFSSPSLWKRSLTLLHFGTPGRLLPSADASIEVSLLNTYSHSWRQLAKQRAQKEENISPLYAFIKSFCR